MHKEQQHKFIDPTDELALLVNEKANLLYKKLKTFNINDTTIDDFGKYYFNSHHGGHRSFFSIQSSAAIIYQAAKKINKPLSETSFIDYGAGLGTLFLLAGMVGFKKVYFNDYFPQWAGYAKIICTNLDSKIDDFITGDIDAVIEYCKTNNTHIDIVASRNVAEHIYSLRNFYTKLYQSGITTVCYATTTANYHNPAMRLKHYWYHYKVEKTIYKKQREDCIKKLRPGIEQKDMDKLIRLSRGRAHTDFTDAVENYFGNKRIIPVEFLGTNTCDCVTGVWAENLINRHHYSAIIHDSGFAFSYTAGFWDTHYKYKVVNLITRLLNSLIRISGKRGYWFAPFVNITAIRING